MAKPLISDEEYNELKECWDITLKEDWANTLSPSSWLAIGGNFTFMSELLNLMRLKESSQRLEKSTQRLNRLTWALIILTGALVILTILSIVYH